MDKPNVIREKSYAFSLLIIKLYWTMQKDLREFVLSKQVLRSGTSIGANVEEALQARSKKDFVAKLSISLQEAHETRYWLRLMCDSVLPLTEEIRLHIRTLLKDIEEIIAILTSIIRSSKSSLDE